MHMSIVGLPGYVYMICRLGSNTRFHKQNVSLPYAVRRRLLAIKRHTDRDGRHVFFGKTSSFRAQHASPEIGDAFL